MKIKPQLFALLLTTGTVGVAQAATQGNLTFEGIIEGGTCSLAAGDVNRTIALPSVKLTDFGSSGHSNAGTTLFTLTANCDADIGAVTFAFSGTASATDPNRFANTAVNGAQGVGLWFFSNVGGIKQTIQPNGNNTRVVTPTAGVAALPLGGAYYTIVGWPSMTKGDFKSEIMVNITYN